MHVVSSPGLRPQGQVDPEREQRDPGEPALTIGALRRLETASLWPLLPGNRAVVTEELVRRFLPMARGLAARYNSANEAYEDLVQVASLGLLQAINRFDPDRGSPFSAFAVPTVLGELKRHFRSTGWAVHVARGAQELAQRVDLARRELVELTGREPRVPELAAYAGLEVDDVRQGLIAGAAHHASSLDTPLGDDPEAGTLVDMIGGEDQAFSLRETVIDLQAGTARIPAQERRALWLRVSMGLKQREIAEQMGCSQMQVSRLLRRAGERLELAP